MKLLTSLSVALALAVFGAATAAAQDVTLTLHHFLGPKSPAHAKFLEPWAKEIEAKEQIIREFRTKNPNVAPQGGGAELPN